MNAEVFVNQIGYEIEGKKFAYSKDCAGENFFVKDLKTEKIVFSGVFSDSVNDNVARKNVCSADFSELKISGNFVIVSGEKTSYPFKIGKKIYDELYHSILRYFYLSRCGQKITDEDFGHEACHNKDALIFGTNEYKKVLGGWHDAGDYGRYVVAGAKSVMDLLLAYEKSGKSYKNFDILEEVRFELEWLVQMQRKDGGVFHKISNYRFCGFIMPQDEKGTIVLAPVSTAATADFAGTLAFASEFYKENDKPFSELLLKKALLAQEYLDNHEDEIYKNPDEIKTGEYGDKNVTDERYFALCSLLVALKKNGNEIYQKKCDDFIKKITKIRKKEFPQGFGWGNVGAYGTEILLKNESIFSENHEFLELIEESKKNILKKSDKICEISQKASYKTCLEKIFWGSNGAICDQSHFLMLSYELTNDEKYRIAALDQLNYLLGCNPLGICYVTKNGIFCTSKTHHRPSAALKKEMPGMLSGGPSENLVDEVAKKYLQNKPPLECYIDERGSYCTNEVAIYWNSALVLLIANLKLV